MQPFHFDGFGGIDIHFDIYCTLCDGKCKAVWAETVGKSSNCPICDATPTEMSNRFLKKFKTYPKKRLRFGFSNCHLKQRILHWLVKGCEHRDFKRWSKSKDDGTDILAKNRKIEYQVSFFGLLAPSFFLFPSSTLTYTLIELIIFMKSFSLSYQLSVRHLFCPYHLISFHTWSRILSHTWSQNVPHGIHVVSKTVCQMSIFGLKIHVESL